MTVLAFDLFCDISGGTEDFGGGEKADGDDGVREGMDESLWRSTSANVGSGVLGFARGLGTAAGSPPFSPFEDARTLGTDCSSPVLFSVVPTGSGGSIVESEVFATFLVSLFESCSIILMPINYL